MKKILLIIFLFVITGCANTKSDNITIISSSFPGYDFARAITKDSDIEVKMLLKPGSEMHDYEPTPKDIVDVSNSDMFIYVGGDSDEWIDDILDNIDNKKIKVIKLMDLVNLKEELIKEGMEEDDHEEDIEYDEHVWTSPSNAINIISSLKDSIINLDSKNEDKYTNNADDYISKIKNIDKEFERVVNSSKRKEIIFADRFPFRYFADEYGLTYYAAFPGCSEQTEASAKTISFLINKVKEDNIPVIFHTELSNKKIAKTISKETKAKILEFNSAHNISQSDFDKGITYIDIMEKNIQALKEALN